MDVVFSVGLLLLGAAIVVYRKRWAKERRKWEGAVDYSRLPEMDREKFERTGNLVLEIGAAVFGVILAAVGLVGLLRSLL